MRRFGSRVTIVQRGAQLLDREDADVASAVEELMRDEGIEVLLRIVVPHARPGITAVAVVVAVFTWNDFAGALVLLQRPDTFTVQLALTRFSTFYATDQGLTFAGMAIAILPPLVLFLVLHRSFIGGLTVGAIRR